MQIVPAWLPVACKFPSILFMSMQLAATQAQFGCDWVPLGYKLYATGRQSHANFACASGQLQAASFLQERCENNYLK
jgi:hypothetical protein